MSGEQEAAGGLSPVKADNEVWQKSNRKDCLVLIEEWYYFVSGCASPSGALTAGSVV